MFVEFLLLIVLIILVVVLLDQRKLKSAVKELSGELGEVNFEQKPAKCYWEYTRDSWWEMDMPDIKVTANLLKTKSGTPTGGDVKDIKRTVKETLDSFKIKYDEVSQAHVGPTVTTITIKPAKGTRIKEIKDLYDDFSLALSAYPIMIEAPIPGTDLIGIQVPNQINAIVGLKEELRHKDFKPEKGKLLIPVGRDMEYKPWYVDLHEAPHLLLAGATNSGKSNFIHSLITSLMTQYSPKELRFIMADPKRIELTFYNQLPYLLTPVIMDYKKAYNAVKWCINEMDRRFEVLNKAEQANINEYNKKSDKTMPFIMFVIDEMADFSVADKHGKLFEEMIKILQMGRAVGIHLIVGSSRPCDETFPGTFRANIVSRLAFSTATSEDSRVILDQKGAERLLGRGDALYMNGAEMPKPVRVQIPFISDNDVKNIIESIRNQAKEHDPVDAVTSEFPDDDDLLIEEARDIIIEFQKASASFLQRKLRIGYARAASILDQLEELGIVGPSRGAEPREVYIKEDNNVNKK